METQIRSLEMEHSGERHAPKLEIGRRKWPALAIKRGLCRCSEHRICCRKRKPASDAAQAHVTRIQVAVWRLTAHSTTRGSASRSSAEAACCSCTSVRTQGSVAWRRHAGTSRADPDRPAVAVFNGSPSRCRRRVGNVARSCDQASVAAEFGCCRRAGVHQWRAAWGLCLREACRLTHTRIACHLWVGGVVLSSERSAG